MNNNFYNKKITLIVSEELDYSFPSHVDLYVGTIEECYTKIKISSNTLLTQKINHSGHNQECSIDEDVMFCNSFVFSIIANSSRTNNNIYGDCICHRINLKTFNNEDSNLLEWTIT